MLSLVEAFIGFFSRITFRISKFGFRILSRRWAIGTASFVFIAATFLAVPAVRRRRAHRRDQHL